ncbi:MAG: phosphate propanoyltransferase [Oscillospiraceae bacterium]|nr:phosphate propanoyltransferase [Oscillospiraceae bacterium]
MLILRRDILNYEAITQQVLKRIFIELEASGRHVHVTKEQALALFGHPLTPKRPLSQPGQYLANERVTVVGPKGEFQNVAVLGPERKDAQVELSMTDARALGITAPVRLSGDIKDTPGAKLRGEQGEVTLSQGVIVAKRHIHMTPEDAKNMGVADKQTVKLQTYTTRPLIFDDVVVRVSPDFETYVHLDYDEANACGFQTGDLGRILP